jgi:protein-S-isoprenylcysteine O-methyltransferase Ste14
MVSSPTAAIPFLFIDLYFIGTFLINGTLFFLLTALIIVIGIHYQILQEERFLTQHYGDSYREYYNTVGRYFTWKQALIQGRISSLE